MMWARSFAVALLLAVAPVGAVTAQPSDEAVAAAQCTPAREGQLACFANRVCECGFALAVPARGLPDRWRWDCSIKRPSCDIYPESLTTYPYAPPVAVSKDRTRVRIDQTVDAPADPQP